MSGILAAFIGYAGGDLGGKVLLWLAGKFGGRVLGRIGDAIEKRRKPEQGAK